MWQEWHLTPRRQHKTGSTKAFLLGGSCSSWDLSNDCAIFVSCLPYVALSIALSWHQPWHGSRGITHNAEGSQTQNTEWKAYAHHCTVERHLRHKHWGEIYIHSAVERDLKLLSVKPPANTNTVEGSLKMYKMYTLQRKAMHIAWSEAHTNTIEGSCVQFLHPQRLSNVTNVLSRQQVDLVFDPNSPKKI